MLSQLVAFIAASVGDVECLNQTLQSIQEDCAKENVEGRRNPSRYEVWELCLLKNFRKIGVEIAHYCRGLSSHPVGGSTPPETNVLPLREDHQLPPQGRSTCFVIVAPLF